MPDNVTQYFNHKLISRGVGQAELGFVAGISRSRGATGFDAMHSLIAKEPPSRRWASLRRRPQDAPAPVAAPPVPAAPASVVRLPTARPRDLVDRLYPETGAGGFTRVDSRVNFYVRVNALLRPEMTVLDLGAGRGAWAENLGGFRSRLVTLKGKCRHVIGVDPDAAVLENPTLDEARVAGVHEPLPLDDASVDLIVAYAVLEHVAEPVRFAAEIDRVLRPGGWFCAWTPNRWGYVGIGATLVPNALHARLLPLVAPSDRRHERDVFPTVYRMNTRRRIRKLFPGETYDHFSHVVAGPPSYNLGSPAVARILQLYARLTPPALGQALHVFVRRRC